MDFSEIPIEPDFRTEFEFVIDLYKAPNRFYHNHLHIEFLFHCINIGKQYRLFNNGILQCLCALYHDVIYEPLVRDNEERSVEFMNNRLWHRIDESQLSKVSQMILATKNHLKYEVDDDIKKDTDFFLTADMAILASPPEKYALYSRDVRSEYQAAYPVGRMPIFNEVYAKGRMKFLESMSRAEPLYPCPELIKRLYDGVDYTKGNLNNEYIKLERYLETHDNS